MSTPEEQIAKAMDMLEGDTEGPPGWLLKQSRLWWRPAACWVVVVTIAVNGIVLPLLARPGLDLMQLAALVAALIPFVAARAWEKSRKLT